MPALLKLSFAFFIAQPGDLPEWKLGDGFPLEMEMFRPLSDSHHLLLLKQ